MYDGTAGLKLHACDFMESWQPCGCVGLACEGYLGLEYTKYNSSSGHRSIFGGRAHNRSSHWHLHTCDMAERCRSAQTAAWAPMLDQVVHSLRAKRGCKCLRSTMHADEMIQLRFFLSRFLVAASLCVTSQPHMGGTIFLHTPHMLNAHRR